MKPFSMWRFLCLVLVPVVLGGMRAAGIKDPIFQAVAHLWVGGLFVYGYKPPRDPESYWVAWALSVLELCAFIVTKFTMK